MKVASLKERGRDGTLVVVSRDLTKFVRVPKIASTLQHALDNWDHVEGKLREVYERLNSPEIPEAERFDPFQAAAPLPRAYHWCDGSAYLSHAELVRKARGADMPENLYHDPLLYQGGSDVLSGPHDPILAADDAWGIDLEAEIAVITDDVPMGVSAADAGAHIKLVMLVNDVSLRNVMRPELLKGFGFYQSKPATAFSPVAVTPDDLGPAWDGRKLALPVISYVNSELLGRPDAGNDLYFDFPTLIAHAATTRDLGAGTIVGSGTIANRDRSVGSSCLAERRMLETIESGAAKTPFLTFGDTVRIEVLDAEGKSVFGAIEQTVVKYEGPSSRARQVG
jgi:fumarylacetoacetate (FAA) hydrolase